MITTEHKVQFSTLVRAAPERAYDALATAHGLDAWFTKGAAVDARTGGSIRFRWENWGADGYTGENGGPVLEARRPERFAYRWKVDSGGYETTVEIDFVPRDGGTLVQLVEHGYEDSSQGMQDLLNRATGWGCVLTLMKFHLEHGVRY